MHYDYASFQWFIGPGPQPIFKISAPDARTCILVQLIDYITITKIICPALQCWGQTFHWLVSQPAQIMEGTSLKRKLPLGSLVVVTPALYAPCISSMLSTNWMWKVMQKINDTKLTLEQVAAKMGNWTNVNFYGHVCGPIVTQYCTELPWCERPEVKCVFFSSQRAQIPYTLSYHSCVVSA